MSARASHPSFDGLPDPYALAAHDRRYSGTVLLDGEEVGVTRQCVHCGRHVLCVRGSGKVRGYCARCAGFVCCEPGCPPGCVPFGQWLENVERGLPPGHRPVRAAVHGEVPVALVGRPGSGPAGGPAGGG
jgi:hypothetical protein